MNNRTIMMNNMHHYAQLHSQTPCAPVVQHQQYPSTPFTEQEDEFLKELVKRHGTKKWHIVSAKMQNKTPHECQNRWQTYLHMCMNKTSWTAEEDRILLEGHSTYGNRWTEIAKLVPGRTDNAVKNRFNALCKKRTQKAKSAMGLGLNDIIARPIQKETKRSKASERRQERDDLACKLPFSVTELMHHQRMTVDIRTTDAGYACLGTEAKPFSNHYLRPLDCFFTQEVRECASPKDCHTDMDEVMGWLLARTPTNESEERNKAQTFSQNQSPFLDDPCNDQSCCTSSFVQNNNGTFNDGSYYTSNLALINECSQQDASIPTMSITSEGQTNGHQDVDDLVFLLVGDNTKPYWSPRQGYPHVHGCNPTITHNSDVGTMSSDMLSVRSLSEQLFAP